ncbi:MAG: apolipoprotein N-acyltransferase [Planctomycetia bacterium]|nr:apolipoprotein N-acyltransferase [Planctomycetia bacterium]
MSFGSALALFASLPPFEMAPLGWIAPVGWLIVIRRRWLQNGVPQDGCDGKRKKRRSAGEQDETPAIESGDSWLVRLGSRVALHLTARPYLAVYYSGFVFWLLALHWLTLPHWATNFGWAAVSFYLAFYVLLFVAISRVAVHRLRVPLILAAPVVWTGMELARGYMLGGFGMANLAHTQYAWTTLIQMCDVAGAYGLSFLMMLVAACLVQMLPGELRGFSFRPLLPLAAAVAAALAYGQGRLSAVPTSNEKLRVALIQCNFDTEFRVDPSRPAKIFFKHLEQSERAVAENPKLDLIVWPESMLGAPYLTFGPGAKLPANEKPPEGVSHETVFQINVDRQNRDLRVLARRLKNTPLLLGANLRYFHDGKTDHYNSALYFDGLGELVGRYDKNHAVIFGEYVPLGDRFPWLYKLMPFAVGLTEGDGPRAFRASGFTLSPSICYESILPHLIAGQLNTLAAQGQEPDILVNVTNDGWFHGSSELRMHLVCAVFRAVECRKPMIVAANTGISAHVDAAGRIVQEGPRHDEAIVVAEVPRQSMTSPYRTVGDWPAAMCLLLSLAAGGWGMVATWKERGARRAG